MAKKSPVIAETKKQQAKVAAYEGSIKVPLTPTKASVVALMK